MTIEHWTNRARTVHTAFPSNLGEFLRTVHTESTPIHCCTIEGEDWTDCMRKYHGHMGWGPYRPPATAKVPR